MARTDILVTVGANVSQFSKSMADANRSLSNFGKSSKDTFGAFKKTGSFLTKWVTAPAMAATTALTGITLVKGFGRLVGIDTARAKLTALGHDAETVELIMSNALESVKGTAYGLDEAATAAASAVAAGIKPGQELAKYLTLTGDAAAIAGAGFDEMSSIFNRVQTAQRAYTMELNMLADRGIPIYQWLAEEAGVSAEAIRDMASKGEISSEMYFNAIEKNIGGAAKVIGDESFMATIQNIGADIARIGANFLDAGGEGEGFFSKIKPLLVEFREYLSSVEDKAAEWGAKFGEAFMNIVEKIRELKRWFDGLSPSVQNIIVKFMLFAPVIAAIAGPMLLLIGFIPNIVSGFMALRKAFLVVRTATIAMNAALLANPFVLIIAAVIGLAYLIYKYWDEIKAATLKFKDALVERFTELKDAISERIQQVIEWFQNLRDRIVEKAIEIKDKIKEFFTETIPQAFNSFITFLQELPSRILEFITKLFIEDIPYYVGYGIGWVVVQLSEGFTKMYNFFKELPGRIWNFLKDAFKRMVEWELEMREKAIEVGKNVLTKIIDFLKELPGRVWNWLKDTFMRMARWEVEMRNKAIETGRNVLNKVIEFIKNLPSRVWNWLNNTISRMKNFASQMRSRAIETGKNVFNSIVDEIKKLPQRLKKLGRDIIQGLVDGTLNNISKVGEIAKRIASRFTSGFKSALGIKSPSRVMIAFGHDIVEGLAQGIGKSLRIVSRVTDKLTEAVTPEAPAISLAYDTPTGIRTTLSSAVLGTIDVRGREDMLVAAIGSLERRLGNLEVVMDGRVVGRIIEPHVTEEQERNNRFREHFR